MILDAPAGAELDVTITCRRRIRQLEESFIVILAFAATAGFWAGESVALAASQLPLTGQSTPSGLSSTQDYNRRLNQLARRNENIDGGGESNVYRIGGDDLLDVSVYGAPDLDLTVRVSADGRISLPLVGDVHAAGLTTRELERVIEGLLERNYMTHPQVNVLVKESQSHSVSVFGAVGKPGVFEIPGPKSLIEVLSLAQGLSNDAGDSVIVMRHSGIATPASADPMALRSTESATSSAKSVKPRPSETFSSDSRDSLQIGLKSLLDSVDPRYNVLVYPGDIVKVPPGGIVYVVGEVRKPGGFLLKANQGISVLQALALAEGTTHTSARRAARIIRTQEPGGERKEIPVNLSRILAGKAPDPVLQAQDVLFIPNSASKSALYRGAEAALSITGGLIVYRW